MVNKPPFLTVGPAPHWRTPYTLRKHHLALLLGLLPAIIASAIAAPLGSGALGTLGLLALGGSAGLLSEYAIQIILRQPYRAVDLHGLLMGIILALMLPPTIPWWVLFFGVFLAILVGKQIFGGLGGYPFHPAMIGLLILTISWPHYVFPIGGTTLATASPTVLYLTLAGGLALALLGHIKVAVPLSMFAGVAIGALLLSDFSPHVGGPMVELFQGHVLLAGFFILTDATSSPANRIPLILFAFLGGFLTVLIRVFGIWPDAIPFAVALVNILNPLLDRIHPSPKRMEVGHA